jgi:predicted 3-demethylubiquinone-9 3-methyltransferase (glyoxalase superfamily)
MSKISPCLWFDGEAEEAAKFYVSLLPDSRIEHVQRNTADSRAGKAGSVLVVEFTLAGQRFMALNGGKAGKISRRSGPRRRATRDAGDDGNGQARHRRIEAGL